MSAFCRTLPVERRTSHGFAAVQFLAERRCDGNGEVLRDQIQRERVYRPFQFQKRRQYVIRAQRNAFRGVYDTLNFSGF